MLNLLTEGSEETGSIFDRFNFKRGEGRTRGLPFQWKDCASYGRNLEPSSELKNAESELKMGESGNINEM